MKDYRHKFPDIPPDLTDWPAPASPGSDASVLAAQATANDPTRNDSSMFGLVIAGLIFAWYCYGCYGLGKSVWHGYLLSTRGVPANAQVTACTPVWVSEGAKPSRMVQRYRHDVRFDGHVGRVTLNTEKLVGTEISVVYLPDSPDVYLEKEAAEWPIQRIVVLVGLCLVFGIGALVFGGILSFSVVMVVVSFVCGDRRVWTTR